MAALGPMVIILDPKHNNNFGVRIWRRLCVHLVRAVKLMCSIVRFIGLRCNFFSFLFFWWNQLVVHLNTVKTAVTDDMHIRTLSLVQLG